MCTTKSYQKFLDPIKDRLLSARALNCCKNIRIENLLQLIEYAKSNDLHNIRNCGPKTILELQDAINRYGPNIIKDSYTKEKTIPSLLSPYVENIFDKMVLSCTEEIQDLFLTAFPNAETLYSQCFLNFSSVFITLPNTESIETVFKCWQLGYDIINNTSQSISQNRIYKANSFESNLVKCLNSIKDHINNAKTELLLSRLTSPLTEALSYEFKRIKTRLSTRAQNILEKEQITAQTIIQFCNKLENYQNIRFCGKKTASDIIIAYNSFYKFLFQLVSSSPKRSNELIIRTKYPFLEDKDTIDIIHFYEECGHLPFFKLIYLYFLRSKNRQDVIYNKANGITTPQQTLTEIASEFGLSRERIRQINSDYLPSPKLYAIKILLDNQFYPFLNMDFFDSSKIFPTILNMEFANSNEFTEEAFIKILSLYKGFKPIICGDKTIMINPSILDTFDFESSIKDISNTITSKKTKDVILPMSTFINNYILCNTFDYQKIENIIDYIIRCIFRTEIDQNKTIHLKQNAIDVEDEFYKILDSTGTPLSFDELCTKLIDLHPTISYASGTLRSFLFNSNRISAIGKTSTYTLTKWNISNLTIRGLIHQILEECNTPLSLDDIVEFLAIKGRKTNKNSINSNILIDNKYDFVKFEGGLIGLRTKNYGTSYSPIDRSFVLHKSFDERINDFLDYIDTNHHIPFASSDNVEASLNRWYRNVIKGVLDVTEKQKELLNIELSKRKEFIMTSSEFAFIENCKDLKYFVSSNLELPTIKTDAKLYNWFSKARQKLFKLTPLKEKAYKDLIQFLSEYGFYIED